MTERGLRYVAAVFTPIPWLTASVAPLAVAVVFGRGAFTGEAVEATASVVVGLAPMLLLTMILPVHVGALNTHRKGTLLLMGGVLNVSLNALFDVVLGFSLGVFGIALSTSLTLAIVLVFFSTRLSRIEPEIRWKPILRTIAGASVASVPVALVAALFAWNNWADLGIDPRRCGARGHRRGGPGRVRGDCHYAADPGTEDRRRRGCSVGYPEEGLTDASPRGSRR